MGGEGADRAGVGLSLLGGVMRMGADGEIDRREALRDRGEARALRDAGRNRHHPLDARALGARDDGLDLVGEVGKVEMAMAVDQLHAAHAPFPPRGGRCRPEGTTDEGGAPARRWRRREALVRRYNARAWPRDAPHFAASGLR